MPSIASPTRLATTCFSIFPRERRCAERVPVIRHGIDISRSRSAQPRDLRAELGIPQESVLLGFLGRFMEAKDSMF